MRAWARRAAALHEELTSLADLRDPRWWLLAGGAALPWEPRRAYLTSDAEPAADTFIGHVAPPRDPMRADEARALADAQERHALEHGGRATLARELVDLIVHSSALDAGLSRALGITYRPLSETLDAWDAWALRMGLLSPRTSGEAHG